MNLIRDKEKLGPIEDLILDDMDIENISMELKKTIESLPELLCLSFNNCNLLTLTNFPLIKTLIRLELSDNKFDGD